MNLLSTSYIAACLLALTGAASAKVSPDQQTQAESLLASGNPAGAQAILRSSIDASDGPQPWFLLGKSAEGTGDLKGAIAAYREVLKRNPKAERVKLDLARLLQAVGDSTESERLFLEVKASNPPAPVVANIDRYLAMMNNRDATGHAYRARATIGGGYDSNVNQGTSSKTVSMFGLPFTLSRDARRRGDGYVYFKGEFDHIYRFSRELAWASNLTFAARKQFRITDFDNFNGQASTGPIFQPGDRTTIMLPVFASVGRFETGTKKWSDRWHSWDVGISPQVRFAVTDSINLNLASSVAQRTYFNDRNKDGLVSSISPSVDLRTTNFGGFTLGATLGRDDARLGIYANRSLGVNAGWQYVFAGKLATSVYTSYIRSLYDDMEAAYTEKRRDDRIVVGVDFVYPWEQIQADILLSYAHTWNISNLPIYSYHKDTVSLGVRKSF